MDVFNGSSWINDVRRLNGNSDAENTWHSEAVDLSPYLSDETRIRFRAYVSRSNEDANVDNVRIVAAGSGGAAPALAATPSPQVALTTEALSRRPGQLSTAE